MSFGKLAFDVMCDKGDSPRYRIFVNEELFVERKWRFDSDTYLREIIQVEGPPDTYKIRLEKLDASRIHIRNTQVLHGPVDLEDSTTFRLT